jgi:PTS system beta-glucosides-specific IIC component
LVINSEVFPQLSCRQPGSVGFGETIIALNTPKEPA